MYDIIFSDLAKKQFSGLNNSVKERIGFAIERIKIRPYKFIKRLYNSKYYRLRVDNYRIIIDVGETSLIIHVIEIVERRKAYK
jgi:mRNA interferase RelE/StbE